MTARADAPITFPTVADRARRERLDRLDVPSAAKALLVTAGVPHELRLEGWVGATLFSSEVQAGGPRVLADFVEGRPELRAASCVIGTTRETEGSACGEPYAAFCLLADGSVELVDLEGGGARFVGSSLGQFLASLALFARAWAQYVAIGWSNVGHDAVDQLARELADLDAAALRDVDAFWPMWLDQIVPE